ncbi:MAG: ABC transporter permease [Firmicutes bacterium HGW-Firmicutes-15]|nr:MAG: ABC transporter permease [Firmicutes bacterium HGW-Firmicutes-15]
MDKNERTVQTADNSRYGLTRDRTGRYKIPPQYWLVTVTLIFGVWQTAAYLTASDLLMPYPLKTMLALFKSVKDPEVLTNMAITMRRVLTGFIYALIIGVPLGFLMGYSVAAMRIIDPLTSSLRQIPIMAWVPLTIVWFGLGDGPTIFLIAFSGLFPIILNTIAGVQNISKDYYNAARSMGAGPWSIFAHIIFPGSLPDILTGMRIALSSGWMSVI